MPIKQLLHLTDGQVGRKTSRESHAGATLLNCLSREQPLFEEKFFDSHNVKVAKKLYYQIRNLVYILRTGSKIWNKLAVSRYG